jgi:hypothetical protein
MPESPLRTLHWIVWYPVVIVICLAVMIPWWLGAQKMPVVISVSYPTDRTWTGSGLYGEESSWSPAGADASFNIQSLNPVARTATGGLSFSLQGAFQKSSYLGDDTYENMFQMSPENIRNYTNIPWNFTYSATAYSVYALVTSVNRNFKIVSCVELGAIKIEIFQLQDPY